MKTYPMIFTLLTALVLGFSASTFAQSSEAEIEAAEAARETRRMEYEILIEEAEVKRALAEEAAKEAKLTVRHREELARLETEVAVIEAEQRGETSEQARQKALQVEELTRMREELSRTHRELKEASRQVALAHRELVIISQPELRIRHLNLGDRAVIGVILGAETDKGVPVIGVSPDGPAEQAGIQAGDIMISIDGEPLDENESGRKTIYRVMDEVEDGDELLVVVLRDQTLLELVVTAERREPTSWQSLIRIPEAPAVAGEPGTHRVIVKQIAAPETAAEAVVAEIAELEKEFEQLELTFTQSGDSIELKGGSWEFEFGDMSEFGQHAIREADIWFGLPHAQGLELATMNPELGAYFETEHGVLVVRANETNAYTLQSGDVVLEIETDRVDTPSDMMRALRELNSGEEVDILIKRAKRDVTLKVIMPENRLSFDQHHHD